MMCLFLCVNDIHFIIVEILNLVEWFANNYKSQLLFIPIRVVYYACSYNNYERNNLYD